LSTAGQVVAYRFGIRPTLDYKPATRPRLTKGQFWSSVNRTVGYTIAGYISAVAAHQQTTASGFGIKAGLAMGVVTAVVSKRLTNPGDQVRAKDQRAGVSD
jgi:hypothetical protein